MTVSVGTKVTGKVTGIKNFGAFVDIGNGQSGLVHISQVSSDYVKDIHDKLSVGDIITAIVISDDNGKIALSIKKAQAPTAAKKSGTFDHKAHTESKHHDKKAVGGDFDNLLASFMKESQDRLSTLKKNTEGKRGGRGGRRN